MKKIMILLSIVAMSAMSYAQQAEEKEAMVGEKSEAIASLKLANELARYGYKNGSVLALVDALQIYSQTPTQQLNASRQAGESEKAEDGQKEEKVSFDYEKVLADAKAMAEGDDGLLAMVDKVVKEGGKGDQRGAVGGAQVAREVVRAYSTDTYTISFVAGRLAEIAVSGDGDTDLDLYVYDSNGNLVERDADYSDDCYVSWVPKWTGRFTIKIVNRGGVYNRYVLVTN